jgi:hypothetical protein
MLRNLFPPLSVWALGTILIWLFVNLGLETSRPTIKTSTQLLSQEQTAASPEATFEFPVAGDYAARLQTLAQRPLFAETRRIPEPQIVEEPPTYVEAETPPEEAEITYEEPPAPPENPNLSFQGFMRTGDNFEALLAVADLSKEQWVRVGDDLLNWTVIEITELSVRLQQDGFEYVVEINQ